MHIPHLAILITMKDLRLIQRITHSEQHKNLFNHTLFHHLRITVLSFIPRDRSLHITIDNTIYTMTPTCTTNVTKPHHLHLFLNPHNKLHYLQHIHNVNEHSIYHLIIIIIYHHHIHNNGRCISPIPPSVQQG